jgi:thiamine pyrophosphate-dependent acetolactate synthase large subunit-like protein
LFLSTSQIETAVRFHLPITIVIINNNGIYAGVSSLLTAFVALRSLHFRSSLGIVVWPAP